MYYRVSCKYFKSNGTIGIYNDIAFTLEGAYRLIREHQRHVRLFQCVDIPLEAYVITTLNFEEWLRITYGD